MKYPRSGLVIERAIFDRNDTELPITHEYALGVVLLLLFLKLKYFAFNNYLMSLYTRNMLSLMSKWNLRSALWTCTPKRPVFFGWLYTQVLHLHVEVTSHTFALRIYSYKNKTNIRNTDTFTYTEHHLKRRVELACLYREKP